MQTKITMLDGTVHIVDGSPLDLMTLVDGVGVTKGTEFISVTGEKINLADAVSLQQHIQ